MVLVGLSVAACFSEQTQPAGDGDGDDDSGSDATTAMPPGTSAPGSTTTGVEPGGSTSAMDTTGDDGATSSTDGGVPECVTDNGRDDACPARAPYCADGTCTACPDLAAGCAAVDPAAPVCDETSGTCIACTEHEQCASGACRIATGECFAEDNRLWVAADADCAAATGTEASPLCTIDEALSVLGGQAGTQPWAVFVAGSVSTYTLQPDAALTGRPIAIIGPTSGVGAQLTGSGVDHLAVLGANNDMYLARVTLDGMIGGGNVLRCTSGDLWVDDTSIQSGTTGVFILGCHVRMRRSEVSGVAGWGVDVFPRGQLTVDEGTVSSNIGGITSQGITTLRRSTVADNYLEGGIVATAGSLSLSNCAMHGNVYNHGHIHLGAGVTASLNYVTALGDPVSCDGATPTLHIRNSIVDNITCAGQVTVDQSLVAPGDEGLGTDNVGFPPADYPLVFVDHPAGQLHIAQNPPPYLLGIATRIASDPAIDFDGDARPGVGQPDYPGIDTVP